MPRDTEFSRGSRARAGLGRPGVAFGVSLSCVVRKVWQSMRSTRSTPATFRRGALLSVALVLCLVAPPPATARGEKDAERPASEDVRKPETAPAPVEPPSRRRPKLPVQPARPGASKPPTPTAPSVGRERVTTPPVAPSPPPRHPERESDSVLTVPDGHTRALGCSCRVAIQGPDTFIRHWKHPDLYRPGGRETCYRAVTEWTCPEDVTLGATDCRYRWNVPEWPGRLTGPHVADTLCFDAPPAAVIEQLKKNGEYRLSLNATSSCSYHCYVGEELYTLSAECEGSKKVTVKTCKTDREAEQQATECEALKRRLAQLAGDANALIQPAADARNNLETGVQAYGGMIAVACDGLGAAEADCEWAYIADWLNKGLTVAGVAAGLALTGGATGSIAGEIETAAQTLILTLLALSEDSWDTEQCDDLLRTMRNRLVDYKIKACEHTKGFHDVCKGLADKERELTAALSKARRFDECRYCDLDAVIQRAEAALQALRAELNRCKATEKKYWAWIDYCDSEPTYTSETAGDICTEIPPLP